MNSYIVNTPSGSEHFDNCRPYINNDNLMILRTNRRGETITLKAYAVGQWETVELKKESK